jgi:hypothetical protein
MDSLDHGVVVCADQIRLMARLRFAAGEADGDDLALPASSFILSAKALRES